MDVHFVLYRSKAKRPVTRALELDILAASVRNNAEEGLSGFLHTYQDHFLQYLEGAHGPLMRKVAAIQKDPRHKNFMILAEGTIAERFFPDWNMGQISEDHLKISGALADKSWLNPNTDIDPMPLILAFAAHAGAFDHISISED